MYFNILVLDIAAGVAGVVTLYYYHLRSHKRSRLPLPPGPKQLPIIGNALDIPSTFPSKGFEDLCKEYNSDIIHLNAFGTDIIAVNSYEAAQELLDRRSYIYSSRPNAIMLSELGGYPYLFVGIPYNNTWKTHRRIFTKYFHPSHTEINQPRETQYIHVLLGKLLDNPEKFMSHIRHTVGAISLSEVYGLEIQPEDDPYIEVSERALVTLVQMTTPGAYLVETFPLLKYLPEWFPGTKFHQVAKKARKESAEVLSVPYNASMAAINNGNMLPSFISEGLSDTQNMNSEQQAQHTQTLRELGVMTYLGAMDTTNAAIGMFFLAMMLYPNVQKTAQEELDRVLGGRLPEHSDIPSLPYMSALLWEVLRWETPLPAGFVHYNTEDDIYNGYYIPKGSVIIPNHRAMLRNKRDYPDPHVFKPERFLKDGKINDAVKNPEDIAFGFGRRKCPGRHLAKSSVWLTMASVLSTFNIEKPVDKNGKPYIPDYKLSYELVNHVKPFECSIKPRSKKAIALVNSVTGH